jgi:hypothetical protein
MSKLIKLSFSVLVLSVFTVSCKKNFLEVQDKSTILRQNYVIDLNSTGQYLTGIYISLSKDFYQGFHQIYGDMVADNIKPVTASSTTLASLYNWAQMSNLNGSTSNNMNGLWRYGYQLIRSCNFVLEKANEYREEDPVSADNILAQAYSIRSLMHYEMVNVFAQPYSFTADASHPGIPYITASDFTIPLNGRNSVAEVYDNIIKDLKTALSLYKPGTISPLYMNANAAKALLARIYLFKGDYTAAKGFAREVSTAIPIMAASATGYPSKLFTDKETEALFQLNPSESGKSMPSSAGSFTGTYTTNFQGRYFVSPKNFVATSDIATLLTKSTSDVRKVWVTSASGGIWNISKYPQNVITGFSTQSSSYYQTLLRSSEMYLTAAEAYAQLNNEDSARFYLDAIRKRANSTLLPSTATGAALLDSIYTERRKELAFEGLRLFDLLRWKKPINRTDAWSNTVKSLSYPSNKAISPIPANDVNITGLSQNDDY